MAKIKKKREKPEDKSQDKYPAAKKKSKKVKATGRDIIEL